MGHELTGLDSTGNFNVDTDMASWITIQSRRIALPYDQTYTLKLRFMKSISSYPGYECIKEFICYIQMPAEPEPVSVTYGPYNLQAAPGEQIELDLIEPLSENAQISSSQPTLWKTDDWIPMTLQWLDERGETQSATFGQTITHCVTNKLWASEQRDPAPSLYSIMFYIEGFGELPIVFKV